MRMTTEPSTICKDGTAEGRRCGSWPALQAKSQTWKWGRPGTGDRPTVGHALVRQPRGEDEKIARSWDQCSCEVLDNEIVMFQVHQQGLHSRTRPQGRDEKEARAGTTSPTMENEAWRDHFGSVHGGPALRQRKNNKMTKEDKLTGRQTGGGAGGGRGELRGGNVPSRRVSP